MVTKLLKQKEFRKKFSAVFEKPEIDHVPLTNNPSDYNAPLLGNALDYFICCHFNYLKKNKTDAFVETANYWLLELKKTYVLNTDIETKSPITHITDRKVKCVFNLFTNEETVFIFKVKRKWKKYLTNHVASKSKDTLYFTFPNKDKIKLFEKEIISRLDKSTGAEEINEQRLEKLKMRYYVCYKQSNGFLQYGLQEDAPRSIEFEKMFGREIIYSYSVNEIAKLIETALTKYNEYKITGNITTGFLKAILILAQILPGIQLMRLAKDTGKPTKNDVSMLQHLIKQIPNHLYKPKKVLISPRLSCGLITGEPDYIMDNLIVDIKTTQDFFSRADYNQLICYYLLYLIEEKKWNKSGIKIKKIGMYYALFGKLIEFEVSNLCSQSDLREMITLIKSKRSDTSYY